MGTIALISTFSFAGGYITPLTTDAPLEYQPAPQVSSTWEHQIGIYGWVAVPNANVTYTLPSILGGEETQAEETQAEGGILRGDEGLIESEIANRIDGIFMGSYRGRNDTYSLLLDVIYLGLSNNQKSNLLVSRYNLPDVALQATEESTVWVSTGYVGYNMINSDAFRLDVVAGLRYASLQVDADIEASTLNKYVGIELSGKAELWDGVIGVDGEYIINKEWYLPYQFDIGAGDSDLTVQASLGVGYRFGWGDVLVSYRYLKYEFPDFKLMEEIDFSGPLLGVNFRF